MTEKKLNSCWEHFHHGADIGVRGFGETVEQAFEQVALAMTAVITDLDKISPDTEIAITCDAPDTELLLVDWLNAIIYEMSARNMLFCQFEVNIDKNNLTGLLRGEKTRVNVHQPAVEVKGATYTTLSVTHGADGKWIAQCVVDV